MAHCSNGPVSSMPGSRHQLPLNQSCDKHPNRLAVVRIQGETDSFSAEYVDMCEECLEKYNIFLAKQKDQEKRCEICIRMKKDVKPHRDPEEGSCGRLYDMCPECYRKIVDAFCDDDDY